MLASSLMRQKNRKHNKSHARSSKRSEKKMVDPFSTAELPVVDPPSPTGLDYDSAAKWSQTGLVEVVEHTKGRQLFRAFLHLSLAEENLSFYEAVEELKTLDKTEDRKQLMHQILEMFAPYVNVSGSIMSGMQKAAASGTSEIDAFLRAQKDVFRLMETDQFPRFKRSDMYLGFLEDLLSREEAEKWQVSFESLLNNQVGRWRFRQFLRQIHAEENLRFWEAVNEFRNLKNKQAAMNNLAHQIQRQYLAEGSSNEVFLPFGVRQGIEARLNDKKVDLGLFDDAIKHVEQVLRNDPYVRFLQSDEYETVLKNK